MRAVAQQLPVPEPAPDDIRDRADEVMARAEFSNSESILDRAQRWLSEVIADVFNALSGGGAGSVVGWLILISLAAGLVFLLVRLQPTLGRGGLRSASTVVRTAGPVAAEHRAAADWRNEADLLTAQGEYDGALRARYRALLADLIEAGLLDDVAGRTPGEYRREFAGTVPGSADRFGAATDQFEIVWYGPGDASADDLSDFIRHEHAVLSAVGA